MLESFNVLIVGIVVVFLALILLTFTIKLIPLMLIMSKIGRKSDIQNGGVHNTDTPKPQVNINREMSKFAQKPVQNTTGNNEIIAVISAALHSYLSSLPGNEGKTFKLLSYRRIDGTAPVWNRTGRLVQTLNRIQGI